MPLSLVPMFILTILSTPVVAAEKSVFSGHRTEAVYQDHTSGQERSRVSLRVEPKGPGAADEVVLRQNGEGAYGTYTDVRWEIESVLRFTDGALRPVSKVHKIFDRQGMLLSRLSNDYDYAQKVISLTFEDPQKDTRKNFTFPIKGLTIDYSTLSLFLESFAKDVGPGNPKTFYLLTAEPELYKVNIKYVTDEILDLPFGQVSAVKVRLIADMGILDDVFDRLVPPTFMWFEKSPAHRWLKYEGLETGKRSTRVTATAVGITTHTE